MVGYANASHGLGHRLPCHVCKRGLCVWLSLAIYWDQHSGCFVSEGITMFKQCCLGLLVITAMAAPLRADEDSHEQRRRQIEQRVRLELQPVAPGEQRTLVEGGGWLRVASELFDDVLRRDRTVHTGDLRLWGRLKIDDVHDIYARVRLGWEKWAGDDSFDGDNTDFVEPRLDRLWYYVNLTAAMKKYHKTEIDPLVELQIGRQYMEIGTGLALSMPMDAVQLKITANSWEVTGMVARLISDMDNIDTSVPGFEHSRRLFVGGQVRYLGFAHHRPFAYFLWQHDYSGETPNDPVQEYKYNSKYVGLGSTGTLGLPDLKYEFEWVYEFGHSYGWGSRQGPDDVSASALDVRIEYIFRDVPTTPKLGFEYLWATGDGDRIGSPTNVLGGNAAGTTDTGFIGFGYRDTGLEFAPRMSNLHMWRFGASFYPFEKCSVKWLRDLEVGFNWYIYRKAVAEAAVSDYTADQINSDLGHELDVYVIWRVTNDLKLDFRLGNFMPGDAFADQGSRRYMYWGVTYSF